MEKSRKITIGVAAGVGGAVGSGVAAATDLPPVPTGLLAMLLSGLLGAISVFITLKVLEE